MKHVKKILCFVIVLATLASLLTVFAGAESLACGAATITADKLNVRAGMGTNTEVKGTLSEGTRVVVLEKSSSEWYKINYHGLVGYVSTEFIGEVVSAENFTASGTVTGDTVRIRSGASTSKSINVTVTKGTKIDVVGINNYWYKVIYDGRFGYIRSDFLEITGASVSGRTNNSGAIQTIGEQVAALAQQFVGYAYVYGAESPSAGFDCSGLCYYCYGQFGYSLSRTATNQYRNNGTKVEKADLKPGDLVFFAKSGSISHVGMYIGDGQFVHASTSKTGVIISSLSEDYYVKHYYGAKRIVE